MDIEKAKRALVNAHKAGDTAAATKLAKAIKVEQGKGGQSKTAGAVDAFTQGITAGFGDNLTALEAGVLGRTPGGNWFDYSRSFGERYEDALKAERGQQDQFREQNPVTSIGAEIAGGLALGAGAAAKGATLVGRTAGRALPTRMAAGAAEGSIYGAGYGAGNADEGSITEGAIDGAKLGAFLGGAIPVVGAGLKKGYQSIAGKAKTASNAPTREALKAEASQAFKAAEEMGVRFKEGARKTLLQGIGDDLGAAKYRPNVNKEVRTVLKELDSFVEKQPTLANLQDYRSFILQQQRNIDPQRTADKEMLGLIVKNIDDFADRIGESAIASNGANRGAAVQQLKKGRELWKRMRKSDLLDEAFFKAENQASGFENGLRVQFRQIVNNKKLRNLFSEDEVKAMNAVVQGGPVENTLKVLGKLGFGVDGASNALGGTVGIGLGGLAGGPVGSMAVAAGATAARKGAEMATRRNADFVRGLVRSGKITEAQAPQVIKALESGAITPEVLAGGMAGVN
jgi:hypothetical protein